MGDRYAKFSDRYARFDEMAWPLPDINLSNKLRFQMGAKLTRLEALYVSTIMDAYHEMITDPEKKRRVVIREIRKAMDIAASEADSEWVNDD